MRVTIEGHEDLGPMPLSVAWLVAAADDEQQRQARRIAKDHRVPPHDHRDPQQGFPLKSECCGRSCCAPDTWHLFPLCTIREAWRRRRSPRIH